MKTLLALSAALAGVLAANAATAQDTDPPKPITVSGSVGIVSDYRFRGVSQSDETVAVQGGITVTHESGVYVSFWGSNLAGWGTFGGANLETDLVAGVKLPLAGGSIDVGGTYYLYPAGFPDTNFFEAYAKLSGTAGPVNLLAGVAYAPSQKALGQWFNNGASAAAGVYDNPGDKGDNLYLWGDVSTAVPDTGLTVKAHLGYSEGNRGLGPFATSVAPTGKYVDWLVGADYTIPTTPLTLSVAYVDTDIDDSEAAYLQPAFSNTRNGDSIADGKVVVSLTAAF